MTLEQLHLLFLEHPVICTDTRKITENCLFFALKGPNFNGNAFASEALDKGASYAIIDEAGHNTSDKIILVEDVLTSLQKLATREDGALVVCLPREPGKRESRYMHCFGEETPENVVSAQVSQPASTGETNSLAERVLTLEQTVSEQQARIDALEAQLKDLLD